MVGELNIPNPKDAFKQVVDIKAQDHENQASMDQPGHVAQPNNPMAKSEISISREIQCEATPLQEIQNTGEMVAKLQSPPVNDSIFTLGFSVLEKATDMARELIEPNNDSAQTTQVPENNAGTPAATQPTHENTEYTQQANLDYKPAGM